MQSVNQNSKMVYLKTRSITIIPPTYRLNPMALNLGLLRMRQLRNCPQLKITVLLLSSLGSIGCQHFQQQITKPRGELTINHSCHMTTLNVHGDPDTHDAHDHQRPLMTCRAQTLRSSRPRAFRACPLRSDRSHRSNPQSQCPNSRIK